MTRWRRTFAAAVAAAGLAIATAGGAALAVGGPNEAGNSGKFHPKSQPCQGSNDHPNCPGRH